MTTEEELEEVKAENASVTIHQTTHQGNPLPPPHQLQIELSYAYMQYGQPPHVYIDDVPTLCVSALNVGTMPSYVSRIEFETSVDGHRRVNGLVDFGMGPTSRINHWDGNK